MLAVCEGGESDLEAPSNSPKGEDAMRSVRKEMIGC